VTLLAADEADTAVLGEFTRRLSEAPKDPRVEWRSTARPDQLLPDEPFRILYFQGGRGSGKTRSGAQALAEIIQSDPDSGGQFGVIGPTSRDAWTVQVEGESGLLRALGTSAGEVKHGTSRIVEYAHRSYGEIGLRSGHVIFVDSADDGAIRVQGKNLRAAWCGEIGLWQRWATAFDESIKFAVRKGAAKIICDGTPKVSRPARALIRRLLRGEEPRTIVRRLRTVDNRANLSEAFYDAVIGASKGTRLERQELEGELLDDVENALWTRDLLERIQVPAVGADGGIPHLFGAVIGVDPSDGSEDSDEQAYTVSGKGAPDDHHLYVAESWGGQMAPAAFTRKVVLEAVRWNARIVVEKNHGGAWLTTTFDQVIKDLEKSGKIPDGRRPRVETIHASQAKRTRAEPVSAMYERDLVRHCYEVDKYQAVDPETGETVWRIDRKGMVELEDQMATFTGVAGEKSPDRLDSLCWSLTPFLKTSFGPPGTAGVRRWAGSEQMDTAALGEEARAHRKMREIAERGNTPDGAPWDIDGFAPAEDEDERARTGGRRGNVRSWR
jgi:phage terminase large subunit-like protein